MYYCSTFFEERASCLAFKSTDCITCCLQIKALPRHHYISEPMFHKKTRVFCQKHPITAFTKDTGIEVISSYSCT